MEKFQERGVWIRFSWIRIRSWKIMDPVNIRPDPKPWKSGHEWGKRPDIEVRLQTLTTHCDVKQKKGIKSNKSKSLSSKKKWDKEGEFNPSKAIKSIIHSIPKLPFGKPYERWHYMHDKFNAIIIIEWTILIVWKYVFARFEQRPKPKICIYN